MPLLTKRYRAAVSVGACLMLSQGAAAIPAAPTFTSTPPGIGNQRSVLVTCLGAPGATFSWVLSVGGRDLAPVPNTACGFAASGLLDGSYRLRVTQTVLREGTSPAAAVAFVVDGTPPAEPTLTTTPGALSNNPTPGFAWRTAEAGGSVSWKVLNDNGVVVQTASTPSATQATSPRLVDGTYTLQVAQTDAAGNGSPAATSQPFSVDTTSPAPPQLVVPVPAAVNTVPKPVFTGNEPNLTVAWTLAGPTPKSGTGANPDFAQLVDGGYVLQAAATDRAGNRSGPGQASFVLDRVAPAAPVLTVQAPEVVQSPRPFFSWRGEPGAQFSWTVLQGAAVAQGPRTTSEPTATPDPLTNGVYAFQVQQIDAAGNRSATSSSNPFRVSVVLAPTTLVVPPSSPSGRIDGVGRRPLVRPFGLLQPRAGARVAPRSKPTLAWRVRFGPPVSIFNLQVFDQRRKKVLSIFPRGRQVRLPASFGKPGNRYYWQVWGFVPGRGYGKKPIGLSYFDIPKGRVASK